jgi:hypothetical protein
MALDPVFLAGTLFQENQAESKPNFYDGAQGRR